MTVVVSAAALPPKLITKNVMAPTVTAAVNVAPADATTVEPAAFNNVPKSFQIRQ